MTRYRLDDLSWMEFERLCQALLKSKFAVGIESWGGHGDHGRDAYYHGRLPIPDASHQPRIREYVFQAKHVGAANAVGSEPGPRLLAAVRQEMSKLRAHSDTRKCDCYVLLTNTPITPTLRSDLIGVIRATLPAADVVPWGESDVSALLDDSPQIRASYPQLLSARDLERIVAAVAARPRTARTRDLLRRADEDRTTFVPVRAFVQCLARLQTDRIAILTGPPEVGKTTIARMAALAHCLEGWEVVACHRPDDFFTSYDDQQKQIFVADDAFGTTEYVPSLAHEWEADLSTIIPMLDEQHRFVWTSRSAPLRMALTRMHLQKPAEHFPEPWTVSVDATRMTRTEKALILYRHARAAGLNEEAKRLLRAHAKEIIRNRHFTPQRAERCVRDWLPTIGEMDPSQVRSAVISEIQTPTVSTRKSFGVLPLAHRRLLIALLDSSGYDLEEVYQRHADEGDPRPFATLVSELVGDFIRTSESPPTSGVAALVEAVLGERQEEQHVSWLHPSYRDLVIECVAESPQERRRFLERCGRAGVELALSVGGGPKGDRQQPFLRTPEDWSYLSARIEALIGDTTTSDAAALLAVLDAAFLQCSALEQGDRVLRWIESTISHVGGVWNRDGRARTFAELRLYSALSERVEPLPPLPDLRSTWRLLSRRALADTPVTSSRWRAVKVWIDFAHFVANNEPRLLRQQHFPEHYEGSIDAVVEALASLPLLKREARQRAASQYRELGELLDFLHLVGELFPNTQSEVEQLSDQAHTMRCAIESRLQEAERRDDDETNDESHTDFVDEIFADL